MTRENRPRRARGAIAIVLAAVVAVTTVPVGAQVVQPYESRETPGWTLVPRLAVGGVYEDNVMLINRDRATPNDYVGTVNPALDLEFLGRRSRFEVGYRGALRAYRELPELNAFDQRGRLQFSRRVTRRTTVWTRELFARVPTTDELEIGGVPFLRVGARSNDFGTGVDVALTERTTAGASYGHTWVSFDRDDSFAGVLMGGYAHGATGYVRRRLGSRVTLGGEYDGRFAVVDRTVRQFPIRNSPIVVATQPFQIHSGAAALEWQVAPNVAMTVAGGATRLSEDLTGEPRTGPYWRAGLIRTGERATVSVGYQRAYVPSYGFATPSQSEELHAWLRMPLARNRFYWQSGVAYRDTDPLFAIEELKLRSWWIQNIVGYSASRWLRLEGFVSKTFQDSRVAGGKIDRTRIGFQIVTTAPMRLQ